VAAAWPCGSRVPGRGTIRDTFDLIMAAYQSTGTAQKDFDALVPTAKDKTVKSEGVILV
jgi:hypothetical protein